MTVSLSRKTIVSVLGVILLMAGVFAFGFVSCLHLKTVGASDLRQRYLLQTGDAPASVRTDVIAALRAFQEGYIRRDPKTLDSFMHRVFPENDDILLLGTDADEWMRGHRDVAKFIGEDWEKWGDFRFAVDDSIVWSAGDVAWIASVGVVHDQQVDRPLRFSAILTRHGSTWLFRQVHFQWDDRDPRPGDVLRASTYLRIVELVLHHFSRTARADNRVPGTQESKDISVQSCLWPMKPSEADVSFGTFQHSVEFPCDHQYGRPDQSAGGLACERTL